MSEFIEAVIFSGPTFSSETVFNNVFVYRAVSLEGNPNSYSAGLLNAMFLQDYTVGTKTGSFFDFWVALLSQNISIKRAVIRNLYNPSDFVDFAFTGVVGTVVAEALAPTSALSYRAARKRIGRNRWRKRFSGISERDWNRGILNGVGDYVLDLNLFGELLESDLSGTDGETSRVYTPVVLYNVIEEVEGVKIYRKPTTALEAESFNERVTGVQYSETLSTQNSRKIDPDYVDAEVPDP